MKLLQLYIKCKIMHKAYWKPAVLSLTTTIASIMGLELGILLLLVLCIGAMGDTFSKLSYQKSNLWYSVSFSKTKRLVWHLSNFSIFFLYLNKYTMLFLQTVNILQYMPYSKHTQPLKHTTSK